MGLGLRLELEFWGWRGRIWGGGDGGEAKARARGELGGTHARVEDEKTEKRRDWEAALMMDSKRKE